MSGNRRKIWNQLSIQIPALLIVLLLLPLGALGWTYYAKLSEDLGAIEKARALEVSASAHRLLDRLGEQLSGTTITNARWEDNRAAVEARDVAWLEENVNVSVDIVPGVDFVVTLDNEGNVMTQAGDVKEFMGRIEDPELIGKIRDAEDLYGMVQTSRGLAVIAASHITDEQREKPSAGVLVFGQLLTGQSLESIGTLLNARLALDSPTGQRLTTAGWSSALPGYPAELPPADEPTERFESASYDGSRYSEVWSLHHGLNGKPVAALSIAVPAEAGAAAEGELARLGGFAAALAALLVALIAIVLRRRVVVPLARFDRLLADVSTGRLTGRMTPRDLARRDEIGSIAQSLQAMTDQLGSIVAGIRETATVASATANGLTGEAEAASGGADRIAALMREAAAGAEAQRDGMRRGSEVTSRIRDVMLDIGSRTSSVAAAAEAANRAAEEGGDTIGRTIGQMGRISEAVSHAVEDARELLERSERIGRMAEAISAIAYRTNILALNAGIEASRAGEQGKGFAVVAGEVRKLAQQANDTAGDIADRIADIRAGIDAVAGTIEKGSVEVTSGTALVRDAATAFASITGSVAAMEGELREIAAAAQEVGARAEELFALVRQTEEISEASTEQSRTAAGIAESQLGAVHRLANAISSLSARFGELGAAVNRFR